MTRFLLWADPVKGRCTDVAFHWRELADTQDAQV